MQKADEITERTERTEQTEQTERTELTVPELITCLSPSPPPDHEVLIFLVA